MHKLGWVCAADQRTLDLVELQLEKPTTVILRPRPMNSSISLTSFEQPNRNSLCLLLLIDSLDEFEIPTSLGFLRHALTVFEAYVLKSLSCCNPPSSGSIGSHMFSDVPWFRKGEWIDQPWSASVRCPVLQCDKIDHGTVMLIS